MAFVRRQNWIIWLGLGAIGGLMLSGLWPSPPLHAVATDHSENYAMATGPVDDNTEAVFFLDFLTGNLRGAVLSSQSQGFQAMYEANVLIDLAASVNALNEKIRKENITRKKQGVPARPEAQVPQNPRFLMVTGICDLRRGAARVRPGRSVVYVAETTTGLLLAYAVPWSSERHSSDLPFQGKLFLWAGDQFAITTARTE